MYRKIIRPDCQTTSLYSCKNVHSIEKSVLITVYSLFLMSCVFDPADTLFGLKIPFFLLSWITGLIFCLKSQRKIRISSGLISYVSLMISIPLISIGFYFLTNGNMPYEGFSLLKAYLLISFSVLLYATRIDLLKELSCTLSILAAAILFLFVLLLLEPSLYLPLKSFGDKSGVFILDNRIYGPDLVVRQIYFVTSPMLIISITYYSFFVKFSGKYSLRYSLILGINILALFISGSRSNIIASLLLPLALIWFFCKKKRLITVVVFLIFGLFVCIFHDHIRIFFDSSELSNSTKISMCYDYFRIFQNPKDLIFGQGLGSYHYWLTRGGDFYICELTYFEVIRNFGLLLGSGILFLLIYPILYAFVLKTKYDQKYIIVGYGFYLLSCFVNPNLFNSMGMLILSIIIVNVFLYKNNYNLGVL